VTLVESRSFPARLPEPYLATGSSSFADFVSSMNPSLLPKGTVAAPDRAVMDAVPHGTTIVSVTFPGGVVMAGDRRATAGHMIAQRDIEKVFAADDHTVVGIAGTAGLAIELVRLFQVELEHYEKMEGASLSLEGKANRLSGLLRNNLGLAMQGLAVVPLFAGFDLRRGYGRIFSYDVTGGRYEEHTFYAVGSGSVFARGSMKKLYRADLTEAEAIATCIEALYDAADDDSATGGPDLTRGIYPVVDVIDIDGVRKLDEPTMAALVRTVVDARYISPDGPNAALPAPPPNRSAASNEGGSR
jgi:proteasome beta subunit